MQGIIENPSKQLKETKRKCPFAYIFLQRISDLIVAVLIIAQTKELFQIPRTQGNNVPHLHNRKEVFVPRMNKSERKKSWAASCCLSNLKKTRHTRICWVHFEGGLCPTKRNPTPTICSFHSHLQTKTRQEQTDPKEGRRKSVNCLKNESYTAPQAQEEKYKGDWEKVHF